MALEKLGETTRFTRHQSKHPDEPFRLKEI
jgi:hypothetical protein